MPLNLLTTIDWQISTVDTTGWNVSSSLAFNPAGQPSIAYSNSSFELRFATQNADRTWAIRTVDTGLQNSGHPSLAFRLGQPAISYQWQQYASGQPGSYPRTQLRYALLRGTLWDINAVHAEFYGLSTLSISLAFSPSYLTGIAYQQQGELSYAQSDHPSTWVSQVLVESINYDWASDCSLAFTPGGQPAIAYGRHTRDDFLVNYAVFDGSSWTHQTVAEGLGYVWDVSLAFTPSGQPAISYDFSHAQDPHVFSIGYAVLSEGNWMRIPVFPYLADIYHSLAFTPSGEPAICYTERFLHSLIYSVFSSGSWHSFTVDRTGKNPAGVFTGPFGYPSLAFSPSGQPAISYCDFANSSIKYAIGTVSQGLTHALLSRLRGLLRYRLIRQPS